VNITTAKPSRISHATLAGHIEIARVDHWIKNVFVIPGIVAAVSLNRLPLTVQAGKNILVGLLATCLVASSNYVLNEMMDAPFDRFHPIKRSRPVPSGRVNITLAYFEWIALAVCGLAFARSISPYFTLTLMVLWLMGLVYNIPPLRSKDIPYVDVLTEAINNPLRLLAGWFIVTSSTVVPGSLLLSYWMAGCYFMALKRYAEHRRLRDHNGLAQYRKSLASFTPEGLMVSVSFYASASMLFFGAFMIRYRIELILSFPFVALVMALYLSLAFKPDSAVEHPEKLYRERRLMSAVMGCTLVMAVCLFIDMPKLQKIFTPTAPIQSAVSAGK